MLVVAELKYDPKQIYDLGIKAGESLIIAKLPAGAKILSFEADRIRYVYDDGKPVSVSLEVGEL